MIFEKYKTIIKVIFLPLLPSEDVKCKKILRYKRVSKHIEATFTKIKL